MGVTSNPGTNTFRSSEYFTDTCQTLLRASLKVSMEFFKANALIKEIHRSADEEDLVEDGELSKYRESVRREILYLNRDLRDVKMGSVIARYDQSWDKEKKIEMLTNRCNRMIEKLDKYMKTEETDQATEEWITECKDTVLGYLKILEGI